MVDRPLDVWAWATRQALLGAGLKPVVVQTGAGPQTVFVGGSGPVLLLLHGAGDQAGTWAQVAPALLAGHTLIIPDLAGHGDSAPSAGPIEASVIFTCLEGVVSHLAAGQRVTVVGNSMGAWMAMILAHRHPDWVGRVVAVNGGPLKQVDGTVNLLPASREEARATMAALRDPSTPELPDLVLDDMVRVAKEGALARFAATAATMEPWTLDEAQLRHLRVPVRLIWGTSDKLMPLAYAKRMLAALPDAKLVPLDRCGHVPQQEAPDRFLAALQACLAEPPAPRTRPGE
jgi:pimeloyl-ACP methyl ester carboxylesterase